MTIVIDSLRPTPGCAQPPTPRGDTCQVEASFHQVTSVDGVPQVQQMWAEDRIIFRRMTVSSAGGAQQVRFVMDETRLGPTIRSVLREQAFDGSDTTLQSSLDLSYIISHYAEDAVRTLQSTHPTEASAFSAVSQDLINYLLVGNAVSPDSVQQERNLRLYRAIASFSDTNLDFFNGMVTEGLAQLNRTRWPQDMLVRMDRLGDIATVSRRLRTQLSRLPETSPLMPRIRQVLAQIVVHLYTGQGTLEEVRRAVRPLAQELFRDTPPVPGQSSVRDQDRYNLYSILALVLDYFRNEIPSRDLGGATPQTIPGRPAPMATGSAERQRLDQLVRVLQSPVLRGEMEYSVLDPQAAMERSILDELSTETGSRALVERVQTVIRPPNLTPEWVRDNGNLREIIHTIFSAIRLEPTGAEGQFRFNLNETQMRTLRFQLDTMIGSHSIQRREFVGATLAVLRHLFGEIGLETSVRAFRGDQLRIMTWNLSEANRQTLRDISRWLQDQIGGSLTATQVALPVAEGLTCLAGAGLITGGAFYTPRPGDVNPFYVAGGGVSGLGCGALFTHYVIPTRNPYISDAIGGGIGALIGVGIPLILHFANPGGGMMMTIPLDGRNPTMGFGP